MTDNRVVFITGASSGIGYATALAFLRRGLHVVGTARDASRLQPLAEAAKALPGTFLPVSADVRDRVLMQRATEQAVKHFGRLDIVVANAGLGHRGAVAEATWDDLDTLIRTNIDGVMLTVQATVPHLRQTGGGNIIMVSSVVFNLVAPYAATYAASKAFVSSLARSLRYELQRDNIRVTDVRVGRTETHFDDNRLGAGKRKPSRLPVMSPEQVADGIVRAALDKPQDTVVLRWIDRLIILGNRLFPNLIGRLAARQYK
jgi:NADP-dependent 3-hydroxy acid dehydrogenase YdfG